MASLNTKRNAKDEGTQSDDLRNLWMDFYSLPCVAGTFSGARPMTNEELDKARAEEAHRIWVDMPGFDLRDVAPIAARLAREGWQPTPAVDPLEAAFGEIHGWRVAGGETWEVSIARRLRQVLPKHGLEIVQIAREDKSAEAAPENIRALMTKEGE